MGIIHRLKIFLWLPFVIFYFPLLVLIGSYNTDELADWIMDID